MTFTLGIDTSTHQDNAATPQRIDWAKPAALGVKFVINRVAFCAARDEDFDYNWAQQRGRYLRGGYGFWGYWPGAPSINLQVQAVVNALKPDPGEFPLVWADVEKASAAYPEIPEPAAALPSLEAYMKGIEDGLGMGTGIYTNIAGILRLSPIPRWLLDKPLWLAWPITPSTGETVEAYIERTDIRPPLKGWSGFKIWQFSWKGPGKEAGMESYGLDMNYYNGAESDLRAWCKQEPKEQNMWKGKPLGYFAKTESDPGWANTGFQFFVGYGCKLDGVEKPNDRLRAMQEKAESLGKPFVISLDFTPAYYTAGQYNMDEALWPSYKMDYPLQRFVSIASSRQYSEIWINFTDEKNHSGQVTGANWLDFALRVFLKKCLEWAAANRPGLKLRVFTNWQFMHAYVADGPSWLHNFETGVKQDARAPLDASYPQEDDKPGWLGVQAGGPFWWYTDRLILFNGTLEKLGEILGASTSPTPQAPQPVTSLSAGYANDSVLMTWQPVAGAVRYDIDVDGVAVKSVEEAACTIDGPTPGTYNFGVVAVGPTGLRSSRVVVVVTVPGSGEPEDLREEVQALKRQMALVLEWLAKAPHE